MTGTRCSRTVRTYARTGRITTSSGRTIMPPGSRPARTRRTSGTDRQDIRNYRQNDNQSRQYNNASWQQASQDRADVRTNYQDFQNDRGDFRNYHRPGIRFVNFFIFCRFQRSGRLVGFCKRTDPFHIGSHPGRHHVRMPVKIYSQAPPHVFPATFMRTASRAARLLGVVTSERVPAFLKIGEVFEKIPRGRREVQADIRFREGDQEPIQSKEF